MAETSTSGSSCDRPKFSLGLLMGVVVLFALGAIRTRNAVDEYVRDYQPYDLVTLYTVEAFEKATEQERSLIFIRTDWSMTSVLQEKKLRSFIEPNRRHFEEAEIGLYVVDATDVSGPLAKATNEWLSRNSIPCSAGRGAGEIVIRNGKTIFYANPGGASGKQLLPIVKNTFGL